MPLVGGNSAQMWAENQASLDAMVEAIQGAQHTIHCEFYILSLDDTSRPFFDALDAAHQRGVSVRVLLDHLGNFQYPGYRRTRKRLDAMGVEWRLMLPFQPLKGKIQRPDLRNHRKLLVADGTLAFLGGINIGVENCAHLAPRHQVKDVHFKVEGPAACAVMEAFARDWAFTTDENLEDAGWWPKLKDQGTVFARGLSSGPDADIYKLELILGAALTAPACDEHGKCGPGCTPGPDGGGPIVVDARPLDGGNPVDATPMDVIVII